LGVLPAARKESFRVVWKLPGAVRGAAQIHQTQREAQKKRKKDRKKQRPADTPEDLPTAPGQSIDKSYLCCEPHKAMVAGLALLRNPELLLETPLALLVVGLAGDSLSLFVHDHFPKTYIDAVEIDPSMLEVASRWFGFFQSDRMKVHIADGLDYITSLAGREGRPRYNVVMFDVDSKDPTLGMSCPPAAFVDQPFLQKVKSILTPEGGEYLLCWEREEYFLSKKYASQVQAPPK